jgi:hypothetical protein
MTASARELEFIEESDALEGASPRPGHFSALAQAQALARTRTPIDVDTLCTWQMLIAGIAATDVRPGTRPRLETLLSELAARYGKLRFANDVDTATLIGDALYGFAAIQPFDDSRVGRLFAAYLATCCTVPIIVFRRADAAALAAARTRAAMRALVADKLREAVLTLDGQVLQRTSIGDFTDIYGKRIVERHALLEAQDEWRRDAAAPTLGTFGGWVCPRCGNAEVIGRHRKFGTRTIEELSCPSCGLAENADSDDASYTAVIDRWRPTTN